MLQIKKFTFNAFQENTYVLYDVITKDCIVVDPGCSSDSEESELLGFIEEKDLSPKRLINTHCHIDHVLGNQLIADQYDLPLESHRLEVSVLASGPQVSSMYGIPYKGSPDITVFLEEGEPIIFAGTRIEILLTPGHSPGSICLYLKEQNEVIAGDVLFESSIGRTDLPGGDYQTLIGSIVSKLLTLPDHTIIHPGHGASTTIGKERVANPFLQ